MYPLVESTTNNGCPPSNLPPCFEFTDLQERKLVKLFKLYDASNTGVLKLSDFEAIGQNLAKLKGWKPGSFSHEQILIKFMYHWIRIRGEIKRKIDRKFDATVPLEEWLLYHKQALTDRTYHLHIDFLAKQIFDVVDRDDNGYLSLQAWRNLFYVYGISGVDAEEAFARIDWKENELLGQDQVISLLEEFYYSHDPNAPGNYIFGPL